MPHRYTSCTSGEEHVHTAGSKRSASPNLTDNRTLDTFDDLVRQARCYRCADDTHLLEQAYLLADRAHAGTLRASGDPYITHPLTVAGILADAGHDAPTLAAALLHDVVEDTPVSPEEIQESFGPVVAQMVDGVTIPKDPEVGDGMQLLGLDGLDDAAGLRYQNGVFKLRRAIAVEPRTAFVKLADVLHNLRTLHYLSVPQRRRIALRTLKFYVPLARSYIPEIVDELIFLSYRNLRDAAASGLGPVVSDQRTQANRAG